jgi:hypothetical protein
MDNKTFDPTAFLTQTVDAPVGDTTIQQCPEGEFRAMIDDFDGNAFRQTEGKEGSASAGKTFTIFQPLFVIQDAAVQAELEREKVSVPHKGIFLDFAPDGSLDFGKGKNVDLNRLREAVNQNVEGSWGFAMLKGAGPVMVQVRHVPDRQDPEKKFAKVTKVVAID